MAQPSAAAALAERGGGRCPPRAPAARARSRAASARPARGAGRWPRPGGPVDSRDARTGLAKCDIQWCAI